MKKFTTTKGVKIDNVVDYVTTWVNNHDNCEIFIGCDSQEIGSKITYATVICLYQYGLGGHVIICKEIQKIKPKSVQMVSRLWVEVEKAVEVADMFKDLDKKITIHIDYNSKPSEKSNVLHESGIGYAKSMGYDAVGKPFAWAATHISDLYCR
ncbi:MAG: hypothetical protein RLY43_53 [Bacteroidota bacterium]|jgi:predicted RNase H-related nuclease YkuK (DUF458 family)